jgi:hypothetical protein
VRAQLAQVLLERAEEAEQAAAALSAKGGKKDAKKDKKAKEKADKKLAEKKARVHLPGTCGLNRWVLCRPSSPPSNFTWRLAGC